MANKARKQSLIRSLILTLALLLNLMLNYEVMAIKPADECASYQEVALAMHEHFGNAVQHIENDEYDLAYKDMNTAYFGYYEVTGFEKYVMFSIARDRVALIEASFRSIKHVLLGHKESDKQDLIAAIHLLDMQVARDALVLDGVAPADSADEVGLRLLGQTTGSEGDISLRSFITSFSLMLREGLEAILVCLAIITYLIKSGNQKLCRNVYYGMLAGILASVALAVVIEWAWQGIGQEMLEGFTMFLAVAVLFYVSTWMLRASEPEGLDQLLNTKIKQSISKGNAYVLVGAAFLAVVREGAELILFYKASLISSMTDSKYAILGFVAAVIVLAFIYFTLRYTTVKLRLRPFFLFTSILLFVLCISFMGKGVQELTEAGVISGSSTLPFMKGFKIVDLGIYDRAETMIPQTMLLISAIWMLMGNIIRSRKIHTKKTQE